MSSGGFGFSLQSVYLAAQVQRQQQQQQPRSAVQARVAGVRGADCQSKVRPNYQRAAAGACCRGTGALYRDTFVESIQYLVYVHVTVVRMNEQRFHSALAFIFVAILNLEVH